MSSVSTPLAGETAEPRIVARGPWHDLARRLAGDTVALVALGFTLLLIVAAVVGAPLAAHLTGHGPNQQIENALDLSGVPLGPWQHAFTPDGSHHDPHASLFVLGSDSLGRDNLVRLLYGARISLIVAFGATGLALLVGTTLGLVAGYYAGPLDAVISRLIETAMAFPALLLAIGLGVVIGPGLINVLIVIALFSWYYPARIVRGVTRSVKHAEFVEAARSLGASDARILRAHVLPQLAAPLLVYGTTVVAANILFEAGLSYLGVGVPLPTASWGQMLSDGVNSGLYRVDPALAFVPGIALVLTMLAFNLLGDGLRDALDPRATRGAR
jgi:peptide/nickel transport system permease protein